MCLGVFILHVCAIVSRGRRQKTVSYRNMHVRIPSHICRSMCRLVPFVANSARNSNNACDPEFYESRSLRDSRWSENVTYIEGLCPLQPHLFPLPRKRSVYFTLSCWLPRYLLACFACSFIKRERFENISLISCFASIYARQATQMEPLLCK